MLQIHEDRAIETFDTHNLWIGAGANQYERQMLDNYRVMADLQVQSAATEGVVQGVNALIAASSAKAFQSAQAQALAITTAALASTQAGFKGAIAGQQLRAQLNSFNANLERRKDEWRLQRALAGYDIDIAAAQIAQAQTGRQIVEQERTIAQQQADQAAADVQFLKSKFNDEELYTWMADILSGVYSYFLQQATATAQLARGTAGLRTAAAAPGAHSGPITGSPRPPGATGNAPTDAEENPDRRGLTGSARLLQDIFRLDQYAFETQQRKLELTETFSLARHFPFEFQEFRRTGVLPFATPMALFDQRFPGHYLRLIRRVRVSVVGLIPPTDGIRATLTSGGASRVVTGEDVFRVVDVRRPPEAISFTSPLSATGTFELQPNNELLNPFETMGVDATWRLELPKPANPFPFDSLADVLFTVEYTALHSEEYRLQGHPEPRPHVQRRAGI